MLTRFLASAVQILLLQLIFGCRMQDSPTETVVWNRGDGAPPAVLSSPQFSETDRSVLVNGEIVKHAQQRWGPAIVDGGSLQLIEDSSGNPHYAKAKYSFSPLAGPAVPLNKLMTLHQHRYEFLAAVPKHRVIPRGAHILTEPQVTVAVVRDRMASCYALDVLEPHSFSVQRFFISPNFVLLRKDQVSTAFESAAWVFTLQNLENLQEVWFKNLVEGSVLQTSTHSVESESPQSAGSQNAPWKFTLDDPRFDQVQAFYYISKGIGFFQKELNFTIPMTVQAQTYFGYPEKTNAAFTYENQIRFGAGDGVTYRNIARDPSVVIHELSHVVIGAVAHLSTQGEGGSMNEGFADFFAASYLDNPKMGRLSYVPAPSFKRDLEDTILFTQRNGGLYHDSQIVSGTLWRIRAALGAEKSQRLALAALARLGAATSLNEFPPAVRAAAVALAPSDAAKVDNALRSHAWPD